MKTKIKGISKIVITNETITFYGVTDRNNVFSIVIARNDDEKNMINKLTSDYISTFIEYITKEEL